MVKLMLLMFFALLSISIGNEDSALEKVYKKQKEIYKELLKVFENENEIEKGRISLPRMIDGKKVIKEFEFYKFVGGINDMPLKSVFDMMQNWYFYIEDLANKEGFTDEAKHTEFIEKARYFQLNIGGKEDYRFGIEIRPKSKELIIVNDKGMGPKYKNIFGVFEKYQAGEAKIAKNLLAAANSPVNKQPKWDSEMEGSNERLTDEMRMFSVISQIAEGARPSEEHFNAMKQASADVIDKMKQNKVTKHIESFLKTLNYRTSEVDKYVDYYNLFSALDDYNKLQKEKGKAIKEKLVKEYDGEQQNLRIKLSKHLPGHNEEFFEKLKDAKDFKNFLKQKGFDDEEDGFDESKLALAIKELKETPEDETTQIKKLKKDIETRLPRVSDEFCKELIKVGRSYIKAVVTTVGTIFNEKLKGKEDGRVLGAGTLVRKLLKEVEINQDFSFTKLSKILVFMEEKGLMRARKLSIRLFPLPETERFLPSYFEETIGEAANQVSHKNAAVMDGMKEDIRYLVDKNNERRQKQAGESYVVDDQVKLVEDSVKWEGDMLQFETINVERIKKFHETKYPLDEMGLTKYIKEDAASKNELLERFGIGVGIYGTLVTVASSIKQFMNGNNGQGALSAAQALHSIGGMTGLNEKLSQKIVEKSLDFAVEKFSLKKFWGKHSEPLAEGLGKAGKIFSSFLGDVPFVGLGFDIYFITEDVKDLENKNSSTPKFLKVAHLILDIDITALTLLSPIVPPVVVLTVIRMTFDDFYTDIKYELSKVKGKGFGAKAPAFFKGFCKAIVEIFTLGLVNQMIQLHNQEEYDKQLFQNMSDPKNYFNRTLANKGDINFNGGIMSKFGGFLSLTLNNNGSFTIDLPEVYTGEVPKSIKRTFEVQKPVENVVLGVGTVASPEYTHMSAELWLLIPFKSYDIQQKVLYHNSSQYGTYYGNKFDNNFYTVRNNERNNQVTLQFMENTTEKLVGNCQGENVSQSYLNNYHYTLYGQEGDDKFFFLGPQSSYVLGNDGKDLYFISPSGGKTVIDNFALDEEMDTLYLNYNYEDLRCYRRDWDLVLTYCESDTALLKHWFIQGEKRMYFRHINIITNDEIEIDVNDSDINTSISGNHTICYPVSIDHSRSRSKADLDLTKILFAEVKHVSGSNFSDTIIGNAKDNILSGGLGNDTISGGMGEDVYVIKRGDGVDTIDNYSTDKKNDTIFFGIHYINISVTRQSSNLILFDSADPSHTKLIMKSWFKGLDHQHTTFVSKDNITFLVLGKSKNLSKDAITIDLSKYKHGVTVDLQNPNLSNGLDISGEVMHDVKILLDSPYDDHLVGNTCNNIITCSGGSDYLQGNSGHDTYIINQTCNNAEIFNYDVFKTEYDLLLINCSSFDIEMIESGSDLLLKCKISNYHSFDVKLIKWFESSLYQHLMVKTLNQWTFVPPEEKEQVNSGIQPYQIETTEDCNSQIRKFDFSKAPFLQVQRFKANSSLCRYNVIGNKLNNYLDPGPSDSYGYQTLTGGNGSDTYVFDHNYGVYNAIDNYATDEKYDHLLFGVIYEHINITQKNDDIVISSVSPNNSVNVTLLNYVKSNTYQHLLIHSTDGIFFLIRIVKYALVKQITMVDYSKFTFGKKESVLFNEPLNNILGSQNAMNSIQGGNETMRIVGGNKNDKIIGGSFMLGEEIIGLDGDDYIDGRGGDDNILGGNGNDTLIGGTGNDIIYGGKGADTIDGGNGSDTVVFSGSGKTRTGVFVNLQLGKGWYADAEGDRYESVESILGSEYNDSLIGNDDDNVIRGYGGEDYIIPAGGLDVLQGGLDSDIYDMKNAYGLKVVNNFATDKKIDTLLLSSTSYSQMCYFYNGDDLFLVIDYSNSSVIGAMGRAVLGEGLLEIKLLLWSSNVTYQHLQVIFSDHHALPSSDLPELGHQMKWISDELLNGTVLQISSVNETSVVLNFNFISISWTDPLPSDAELYYIHADHNSSRTNQLSLPAATGSETVTITNLKQGVKQLFSVLLMSCNVSVAVSPLEVATTLPSPPIHLKIYPLKLNFVGFTIRWIPPDNTTDPNVFNYNYTIKYWKKDFPNISHIVEYSKILFNQYTTFKLAPSTYYKVAVASRIDNIVGAFSTPKTVKTGYTSCMNFSVLPKHLHIEKVEYTDQGKLVAYVYCDHNYRLTGDKYIECNRTSPHPPKCVVVHCYMPSKESLKAFQTTVSHNVFDGDMATWNCSRHYQTKGGKYRFSSTCVEGSWSPPLEPCVLSPACPNYSFFANGHADPPFAYLNEAVTLSCDKYYARMGPEKKVCISDESQYNTNDLTNFQSAPFYYPQTPVNCIRHHCPALLPQPHGVYSHNGETQSGVNFTLTCHTGYFVRIVGYQPERVTLTCTKEGTWSVEQKTCQPILKIVRIVYIETNFTFVTGELKYTVPKWESSKALKSSLYQCACDLLGGKKYILSHGMKVTCSLDYQLRVNPPVDNGVTNPYSGILTIVHDAEGTTDKVCVPQDFGNSTVKLVCRELGYGNYTASLKFVQSFTSTKALSILKDSVGYPHLAMIDKVQQCNKMIACRATCQPLLLETAANTCDKTLEGESCSYKCPPGSALLGSATRTCQGDGTWSGDNNNCDAEKWESDIDRLAKDSSSYSYSDLASSIGTYLYKKYPEVTWVVIIYYNPVDGCDNHILNGWNCHHKFHYYGHNIIVGRLLTPPPNGDIGLSNAFNSAFSLNCKETMLSYDGENLYPSSYYYDLNSIVKSTSKHLEEQGLTVPLLFMLRGYSSYAIGVFRGEMRMSSNAVMPKISIVYSVADVINDAQMLDSRVLVTKKKINEQCSVLSILLAEYADSGN